jgi:hypothetical protein
MAQCEDVESSRSRRGKQIPRSNPIGLLWALMAALLLSIPLGGAAEAEMGAGPFAALAGSWRGSGFVRMSQGETERIRCVATYDVPTARDLQLRIRCASDAYNFDLTGSLSDRGGALSGSWSEATRGISGTISGRAGGSEIRAIAESPSFSAGLTLVTQSKRQSVTILPQGADVLEVAITFARS